MAHTLRFSYGGSTINFNSGSITLRNYVPTSPNLSTIDSNSILRDGGRRTLTSRRNVSEGCQILVKPPSGAASDIEYAKFKIQKWLVAAEKRQEGNSGSRVYVEYAPDGLSASVYRSELLGGKVEVADNSLDTRWTQNRAVELDIAWSRRHYWEGSEQTLTLFNSGSTSACATIRNHNPRDFIGQSGCYNNWVQIAGSHINGEIETPATIEIHNRTGDISAPKYYVFHGYGDHMINFPTTIEAESGSWIGAGSTLTSACVSSGSYRSQTIASNITSWTNFVYFTIPSASLQAYAGKYYNIVAALQVEPTYSACTFLRVKLTDSNLSGLLTLSTGQSVEIDTLNDVQSLGVIQIPPISFSENVSGDQRLYIQYKSFYESDQQYNLDCIYIMPTDGARYATRGFVQELNYYMVDDGEEDLMYEIDSTGALNPYVKWRGNPIMLQPGEDQRIYVIQEDGADYDPFRVHGVKVKYRPRRLTI